MTRHWKDRTRQLAGGILHPIDYVRKVKSKRRMAENEYRQAHPFFPPNGQGVEPYISLPPQAYPPGDRYENIRHPFPNALPVYSAPVRHSTPHAHPPPMNSAHQYAYTAAPQPVQYAHPDMYSRYPSHSVMTNERPPPVPPKDFIPERINRTPLIFQYQSSQSAARRY